jgi:hypothetical protein
VVRDGSFHRCGSTLAVLDLPNQPGFHALVRQDLGKRHLVVVRNAWRGWRRRRRRKHPHGLTLQTTAAAAAAANASSFRDLVSCGTVRKMLGVLTFTIDPAAR